MKDKYNLERFVSAQNAIYETVLAELRNGLKITHWMWFVFPQLKGLGHSSMSEFYGISGVDEAREYMKNTVLGLRYNECLGALLESDAENPVKIFGFTDSNKFRSSLTLFAVVDSNNSLINMALQKYFAGIIDYQTEKMLNRL
jgi:uncharacterized protein (DUF1810 family)